ncbi:hypothetical protein GCM10010919_22900 [Alishewanella longhuensis]|uniref:Lipoprotein n=1 Tax=Alishewanella longhuensis TaxID=1091037 RepID=A0ABQ3L0A2_9ALTE|nr:hypothetical protein [Alishewanella longhuensis]GHG71520.1 hypothetical protein GCM10010919_22900 [Alishewanella longhuensis]
MAKRAAFFSSTLISSLLTSTLLVSATLLLTGCALSKQPVFNTTITGDVKVPLTRDKVSIYSVAPVSYAEIAKISASSVPSLVMNDPRRMDEVVKLLQIEAAKLGANAIVFSNLNNETIENEHYTFDGTQGGRIKEIRHIVHVQALAVYVDAK